MRANRLERLSMLAPAVTLLAVLSIPPIVLSVAAGWPLPTAPDVREAMLLRWISPRLAMQLAATVGWLCWIYLLAGVTTATVAQLRQRNTRALLPGMLARLVNTGVAAVIASTGVAVRHPMLPVRDSVPIAAAPLAVAAGSAHEASHQLYEVKPRDTLWDIAASELGDPLRWREIWQLNADQAMTDGDLFDGAGLIRPGWQLRLPVPALGPPLAPSGITERRTAAPAPAVPLVSPDCTPPVAAPAPAGRTDRTPTSVADHEQSSTWLPAGLGLGAAAIGIALTLDQRRRRAMRQRPVGQRIPLPTGQLADAERALRDRSVGDTARFVGGAARLAGMIGRFSGDTMLRFVLDRPDGVELIFASDPSSLLHPFQRTDRGWLLPVSERPAVYVATDRADPAPALVEIGTIDGSTAYVNLEAFGALALDGDPVATAGLLIRIGSSLSGAPWSDLVELRIAEDVLGFDDLAGHATRVNLVSEADRLSGLSERTTHAVRAAGATSLASLRLRVAEPPDGISLVIATPTTPGLDRILELAQEPTSPVVLLLTGTIDGVDTVCLTDDRIELTDFAGPVTADPLSAQTADLVHALIAQPDGEPITPDVAPYDEVVAACPPQPEVGDMTVAVLGPVEFRGAVRPMSPTVRDVVLYLALHRDGADAEKLTTTLWPGKTMTAQTLRNRVHDARRALDGRVSDGPRWRLDESVNTDWAQFQALAAGDLADKSKALALVRGLPLSGIDAEWVSLEGFTYEMEATIVDLAAATAQALLDGDDPSAALDAARAGLRTSPWDERLVQIAMRAAAATKSLGELKRLHEELRIALDLDTHDEIDPETEALFTELMRTSRRTSVKRVARTTSQ